MAPLAASKLGYYWIYDSGSFRWEVDPATLRTVRRRDGCEASVQGCSHERHGRDHGDGWNEYYQFWSITLTLALGTTASLPRPELGQYDEFWSGERVDGHGADLLRLQHGVRAEHDFAIEWPADLPFAHAWLRCRRERLTTPSW
jgi:hypothetical protein